MEVPMSAVITAVKKRAPKNISNEYTYKALELRTLEIEAESDKLRKQSEKLRKQIKRIEEARK
jgi:hypothetical protein